MASITKLMTVLVALQRLPLDGAVTIPAEAARVGESSLDLRAGQRVPVRDLVIGTLVPSANDAATALAVGAGGSMPQFVRLMNGAAREMGLVRTRYRNPHGLDEPGHVSSAADSAALLRAALRVPIIRRYAGASRATLSDGRVVESTDNLIGRVSGFVGGKTGHTTLAGWSQVAFARASGVGVTASVLGASSEAQRDRDLAALLRFGLQSYRPSKVVDPRRTYARVPSAGGSSPWHSSRPGRSCGQRRRAARSSSASSLPLWRRCRSSPASGSARSSSGTGHGSWRARRSWPRGRRPSRA